MKMDELVVVLPAYNEEEDVERLVSDWQKLKHVLRKQYHLALKIVVINDGSSDATETICKRLETTYDNFKLVSHEENKGLGKAVQTGLFYAISHYSDCKYVCLMDCDNTQKPSYIQDLLSQINSQQVDVVIASRYQEGANVYGLAKYREFMSYGARFVYSTLLQIENVRDYTCGYRLYTKDVLLRGFSQFEGEFIEENGFTCMAEILYKLHTIGAKFSEVPFNLYYDEKEGQSKMRVLKTVKKSIYLAWRLKWGHRERFVVHERKDA